MVGNRPPNGQDRPNLGDNLGVVNRPGGGNSVVNRPGVGNTIVNRPGGGNTVVNRPGGGNTIINRPGGGNTVVNRPNNINTNITNNNITNISTNVTNVNRGGQGGIGGWGGGFRPNPYSAYHRGWVNGNWNANYNRGWGWNGFGNSALGWGVGIGVAAWGIGSMWNSWGYSSFMNPYYVPPAMVVQQPVVVVQQQPVIFDYSRPLDLTSQSPPSSVIEEAGASFDAARSSFHAGDYGQALKLADQVLLRTPNDPYLHQFRASCLFALGRYDEAAVPMYTVLSSGPGWDWTTLVGLYPSVDAYTQQLRALENYCAATPGAAAARFLLASLYLTQGSSDHAAEILRQVVAIQPRDRLAAQLLESLTPKPEQVEVAQPINPSPGVQAQAAPALARAPEVTGPPPEPSIPTGVVPEKLVRDWTANPAKDVTINLSIDNNRGFAWKVSDRGQVREFRGSAAFDNDILALTPPDQPPMAGNVTWKDDKHFQFRAIGAPPDDPGLTFGR